MENSLCTLGSARCLCPLRIGMAQQSVSPRRVGPVSLAERARMHSSLPVLQTQDIGILLKISFDSPRYQKETICQWLASGLALSTAHWPRLACCIQHRVHTVLSKSPNPSRRTSTSYPLCRSPTHQVLCFACGSNNITSTLLHRCWCHFPEEDNQSPRRGFFP